MSTPSSELPPAPGGMSTPTQIADQQTVPSSAVPMAPPGAGVAVAGQTNTLAVVSLATAILAPFGHFTGIGGLTLTIVSIVTGHMARRQIRSTGEKGDGFALAGLIISYVHLALSVLVFIFFFGVIIAAIAAILAAATGH
jgi:uncharacterized protein DUF4190